MSVAAWADKAAVEGVMVIVMTLVMPGYLETVRTLVKVDWISLMTAAVTTTTTGVVVVVVTSWMTSEATSEVVAFVVPWMTVVAVVTSSMLTTAEAVVVAVMSWMTPHVLATAATMTAVFSLLNTTAGRCLPTVALFFFSSSQPQSFRPPRTPPSAVVSRC